MSRLPAWTPPPPAPSWTDIADLNVQDRLADIADMMLWLGVGQLALGILGTAALVATLVMTRKSTEAAMAAIHAQREETRAIVVIAEATYTNVTKRWMNDDREMIEQIAVVGSLVVKNIGASAAFNLQIRATVDDAFLWGQDSATGAFDGLEEPLDAGQSRMITVETSKGLSTDEFGRVHQGIDHLLIFGELLYKDAFGLPHLRFFAFWTRAKNQLQKVDDPGVLSILRSRYREATPA